MGTRDRKMIRLPGGTRQDHAIQNSLQFKAYGLFIELFLSGIFHLMCSDLNGPQVTETVEQETADGGGRVMHRVSHILSPRTPVRKLG